MEGLPVSELYGIIKEEGVSWVAGKHPADRVVKSVSVIEIADCIEWLQGGEMVLTTLSPYKTEAEKIALTRSLSTCRAACMAIHPGNSPSVSVPDELLRVSDELEFPIFVINKEIPYSFILQRVYETLLKRENRALREAKKINVLMTQILLSNGGVSEIITKLANVLNNNAVLLDESFCPVEAVFIKEQDFLQQKLPEVCEMVRQAYSIQDRKSYMLNEGGLHAMVSRIQVNNETYYYLLTFLEEKISDYEKDLYRITVSGTVSALELDIMKKVAVLETEEQLKYHFFDDIISGTNISNEVIKRRAMNLSLNPLDVNFVVIFDIDHFEQYFSENKDKGEAYFQKIKTSMKRAIRETTCNMDGKVILSTTKSDEWILLIGFKKRNDRRESAFKKELTRMSRTIMDNFSSKNAGITLSAGVSSNMGRITGLKDAYMEATFSKQIGSRLFGAGKITFYDDLGVYKLLTIPDTKEKILKDKWFSVLYEYDNLKNGNLIQTLEAFLDSNGSIKETSLKLFTHPNTIKYRLKKIIELTGEDLLADEQKRLYYHILIKSMKMISLP